MVLYSVHARSHVHQAPDSPLASSITTPAPNHAHLGPLDLAPSKTQQTSPSHSPCTSPHRPLQPLTPPLTPSSLNDSASQGGLPATPTDLDTTTATIWRRKSKYLVQKRQPTSDSDDLVGDITSGDCPYPPLTQSQQPESTSPFSRYLCPDTLPSRFLLVSGVAFVLYMHVLDLASDQQCSQVGRKRGNKECFCAIWCIQRHLDWSSAKSGHCHPCISRFTPRRERLSCSPLG